MQDRHAQQQRQQKCTGILSYSRIVPARHSSGRQPGNRRNHSITKELFTTDREGGKTTAKAA
jgi:hypothetical protein